MKKLITAALVVIAFSFQAQAQRMSKNALGIRFGGGRETNGFELSYQHKLSKANRLEIDFGWSDDHHHNHDYDAIKLTGLYQWVWKIEDGFNWYVGRGAGVGKYSYNHYYHKGHI